MKPSWDKRKIRIIETIESFIWPLVKKIFRFKIRGTEYLTQLNGPTLFVSNHNSGALIASLSALMIIKKFQPHIFGFTHPSLFKIPLISNYFESLGAVPATYEVANEIFSAGSSLMIFPGGNAQALRPVSEFKINHFRDSHGWAKIAKENGVKVVPITFKNTHFINPIFFSGNWISKILILPWLLKLKITSISLGQIISALLIYFLVLSTLGNTLVASILAYLTFVLTPLTPIIPVEVVMTIHPAIDASETNQTELEMKVNDIMDRIYAS